MIQEEINPRLGETFKTDLYIKANRLAKNVFQD